MGRKTKRRLIDTYVVRLNPASEESRPSVLMRTKTEQVRKSSKKDAENKVYANAAG